MIFKNRQKLIDIHLEIPGCIPKATMETSLVAVDMEPALKPVQIQISLCILSSVMQIQIEPLFFPTILPSNHQKL